MVILSPSRLGKVMSSPGIPGIPGPTAFEPVSVKGSAAATLNVSDEQCPVECVHQIPTLIAEKQPQKVLQYTPPGFCWNSHTHTHTPHLKVVWGCGCKFHLVRSIIYYLRRLMSPPPPLAARFLPNYASQKSIVLLHNHSKHPLMQPTDGSGVCEVYSSLGKLPKTNRRQVAR